MSQSFINPLSWLLLWRAGTDVQAPNILGPQRAWIFAYEPAEIIIDADGPAKTFTASALPPGLTFDTRLGVISGTPRRTGLFVITVTATNELGTAELLLYLRVQNTAKPFRLFYPG